MIGVIEAVCVIRLGKRYCISPENISEALNKIDFTTSRKLILKAPLYCRPIRDITPEKPNIPDDKTPKNTGTKPRTPSSKIPGLPAKAQKQALERQKKKENEKRRSAEKENPKNNLRKTPKEKRNETPDETPNAFDILMRRENSVDDALDGDQSANTSPTNRIPEHCMPNPMTSLYGQSLAARSRAHSVSSQISFDCSPDLREAAKGLWYTSEAYWQCEKNRAKNKLI